jgi:acyl-CoA synthetase (NDP forming)
MALYFAQLARQRGLGFSHLVTTGNSIDVRMPECVAYLLRDADTDVIVIYLEGLSEHEGRTLCNLVRTFRPQKPIIICKPGRTETGKRAVASHTGALAGNDRVTDAAFEFAGILRIDDTEEAWDAALNLAKSPLPASNSIVVIADGGGAATIVADTAHKVGTNVPILDHSNKVAQKIQ